MNLQANTLHKKPVILTGASGSGKSHIAQGIAVCFWGREIAVTTIDKLKAMPRHAIWLYSLLIVEECLNQEQILEAIKYLKHTPRTVNLATVFITQSLIKLPSSHYHVISCNN